MSEEVKKCRVQSKDRLMADGLKKLKLETSNLKPKAGSPQPETGIR
jgi:hypothetical protein